MNVTSLKNKTIFGINEPIVLSKCDSIIILNCIISGPANQRGIYLYQCSNITIIDCSFTNLSAGVSVDHCNGSIVVSNCTFKNMMGPFPAGQAVQFNNFNGSGGVISNNLILNYPLQSNPEDAINLYQSNGTEDSPILITGNRIRGGGPSKSGGGIMLGDSGGSWQVAQNNTLVNPGQYGMAISGGANMSLLNNIIYGKQQSFTNVGLYVKDYAPIMNPTVRGNRVNFINKDGVQNNSWFGYGLPTGVTADNTLNEYLIKW
jgi:parallel beta-helix repeat protein